MDFKFREKHMFEVEGIGSFEFDTGNLDALEAVQRGYPEILACMAQGQKAMREFTEYCASLGVEDPNAATTADLMKAVVKKLGSDNNIVEKSAEFKASTEHFNEEAFQKCVDYIQGCLGEAEYAQIFQNQKGRDLQDHIILCKALFDDAMAQRDKVVLDERAKLTELMEQTNAAEKTPDGDTGPRD